MKFFKKRISAFRVAFQGAFYMFRHETHAQIHLCAAICVIVAGVLFKISLTEWCIISLCIGGVFMGEAFNTSIEKLADKITMENDPLIKTAKDVAAAGVLLMAMITIVIACLIFIPKF